MLLLMVGSCTVAMLRPTGMSAKRKVPSSSSLSPSSASSESQSSSSESSASDFSETESEISPPGTPEPIKKQKQKSGIIKVHIKNLTGKPTIIAYEDAMLGQQYRALSSFNQAADKRSSFADLEIGLTASLPLYIMAEPKLFKVIAKPSIRKIGILVPTDITPSTPDGFYAKEEVNYHPGKELFIDIKQDPKVSHTAVPILTVGN